MSIVERSVRFVRGALLSYGPSPVKRLIWNREYSRKKWAFAENSIGDCVYEHLEKYAQHGSILDMGCGSGNTANELLATAYERYLGVDISQEALDKAAQRSKENGRQDKNHFDCGDLLTYAPQGQFDVILFRESMYHVPLGKIKSTLDHYTPYLKSNGVFIVRLFAADFENNDKQRPNAMLAIMEQEFEVIERRQYPVPGKPTVIVFRPKRKN